MDAKFEKAVAIVLSHEGKFVNDPNDPGAATNYGISLRFLKASGIDVNCDGYEDISDLKALTQEQAIAIYKKYFWDKYNYAAINSTSICCKVFDLAINMGPKTSTKLLQRAIALMGSGYVQVDGIMGPETLELANECPYDKLLDFIKFEAVIYYTTLVLSNLKLMSYLEGWTKRAFS